MQQEDINSSITYLMSKGAGDMVSPESKLKALTTSAGMLAMEGNDGLLTALDNKYHISNNPALTGLYKAARRSYVTAKKEDDDFYDYMKRKTLSDNSVNGTLTDALIKEALTDSKVTITPAACITLKEKSDKRAIELEQCDKVATLLSKGLSSSKLGIPAKDLQKTYNKIIETQIIPIKDPERRGEMFANLFRNEEIAPKLVQQEVKTFSDSMLLNTDGTLLPEFKETFSFFNGIDKNPEYSPSHFSRLFANNTDALRTYQTVKHYMGGFNGTQTERMTLACQKVQKIREAKEKISPEVVQAKYTDAVDNFDDFIDTKDSWLFWKNTNSDTMRNLYKSYYLRGVKNELRMGHSLEVAQETAVTLSNNRFSYEFGQVQDTNGVSIATRGGFKNVEQLNKAFDTVVIEDKEFYTHLEDAFGANFNVHDRPIYFDSDTNQVIIGGTTGKSVSINISTIKAKHDLYLDSLAEKEESKRKESAQTKADKSAARVIHANDKIARHLLNLEQGYITKSPYKNVERASSEKFKSIISNLPNEFRDITYSKYKSLGTETQTEVRKAVNTALSTTESIKGISTPFWEKAILKLSNRKGEITPYKSLWDMSKTKVSNFVTPETNASALKTSKKYESKLENTLSFLENNKKGSDFKNGKFFSHASKEGGTKTIGYGHKLTKAEATKFKDGISEKEALSLFRSDLKKAEAKAKRTWTGFDSLPSKYKKVIEALTFNVGSVTTAKWPSLAKAMKDKDDTKVRKEMITSFKKDGKKMYLKTRAKAIADAIGLK
jgi:GH24 family phage-related lysozyme (muramidase)